MRFDFSLEDGATVIIPLRLCCCNLVTGVLSCGSSTFGRRKTNRGGEGCGGSLTVCECVCVCIYI